MVFAKHSAFSYEDLSNDKYGADFGANYFDPSSGQTLREAFAYDKMGNVLELRRDSIDHLFLTYSGNQLIQVSDAHGNCMHATEYRDLETAMPQEMAYDANGNLQYDLDRRISAIHYNLLNLPELICFMDGRKIVNLYDAAGRKHGTWYYVQDDSLPAYSTWYDGHYERTDYADTLVPSLCRVHHAEGYVSSDREAATPPVFYYYHRDHLGNNCVVWNATADSVVQRTRYYASGMPMAGSTGQPYQPYKYNGKEFVTEYGYDTYDYGFRNYYSAIGRFTSVDPLAEKYYNISPYAYCANNPVKYVDLDGKFPIIPRTHQKMVFKTFKDSKLSFGAISQLIFGTGIISDFGNMSNNSVHLDNMTGTISIANVYIATTNAFMTQMHAGNYVDAGVSLHTIADFYAHSNYIEQYSDYARTHDLSMDIKDIPTFSEAMKDKKFMQYLESNGGLRTGEYENVIKDYMSNDKKSHKYINKDTPNSINGSAPYDKDNPMGPTRYEAAKVVSQKDLDRMAKPYKNQ